MKVRKKERMDADVFDIECKLRFGFGSEQILDLLLQIREADKE